MKRPWPILKTDAEAAHFVEEVDLTEFDFAQMVPAQFEFEKTATQVDAHLPKILQEVSKTKSAR